MRRMTGLGVNDVPFLFTEYGIQPSGLVIPQFFPIGAARLFTAQSLDDVFVD